MIEGKYIILWHKYLPVIKILLKNALQRDEIMQLNKIEFKTAGDRNISGYIFNLEIEKGKVLNDISGTAVARDLFKVLIDDAIVKEFLKDKKVKINMGHTFLLKIKTASM